VRRAYEPWDAAHLVIDTAGQTVEQSVAALQHALTWGVGSPRSTRRAGEPST
jgi:hypothetical protein